MRHDDRIRSLRIAAQRLQPRSHEGAASVRLLPSFDSYLLGYRPREHAVAPEFARRVWPGGGWLHPVLLVDGRAAGTWRRDGATVRIEPFEPLPAAVLPELEAEAADVGRFLGTPARLAIAR